MRRANQDLEELTSALAEQLEKARDTYASALRMVHSPHPVAKVLPLFQRDTYGGDSQITVQPYSAISPGIAMGFETGKGQTAVSMRPAPSRLTDDTEVCDCEIIIEDGSSSSWMTLELDVEPRYVRPASAVSLSVFGEVEFADENWDKDKCKVDMFCFDVDGKRHSLTNGAVRFMMPQEYGQARADFNVSLPAKARIDFDRPIVLVLFFAPQATRISFTDFYVAFA